MIIKTEVEFLNLKKVTSVLVHKEHEITVYFQCGRSKKYSGKDASYIIEVMNGMYAINIHEMNIKLKEIKK